MRLELTLVGLIAMIVLVRIFIPVDTVTGMASSDEGEIDEGIKQVLMEYFIDYDSLQAQLEQRQEQIDLVQQVGARQGLPDTFYPAHLFIISNGLYEQTTCSQVAELFWIEECQGLPKDECEAEMHCTACEEGGCGCSLFKNYPLTYHAVSCNFGMGQVSFKDAYNLGYSGPVEGLEDTETNLRMYFLTMKRLNEDARTQTIIDRIIAHDIGLERLTQIKETYGETFEEYYIALPFPKRYAILAGKVLTIASVLQEPTNDDLEEHIENALSRLSIPPVEQISSVRMSSLPRFRIDEDYALSQMSQMKEDAKNLISTCKGEERVEQCVQDNLPKDWQTGSTCATVFDKAIAYIDQCASAINPPCNCFYDSIKQDETITFTNTDGGIRVAVGRSFHPRGSTA